MHVRRFCLFAALLTLAAAPIASAIQPQRWVHSTEADFEPGETQNTVITNLGDIKLAVETKELGEMPEQASIIYDVRRVGDTMYLAAGPEGRLLSVKDGEVATVAELEGAQVFTLAEYDGKLLVPISGSPSRLAILEDGKLTDLLTLEDVRYIWDVMPDGKKLILATGSEGQILRVDPDNWDAEADENPGLEVLLDTEQSNILCLARAEGTPLYAGTDTEGYIYRLTFEGDEVDAFVVYDAAEPEIGALVVRPDGTVYAGTADAQQARPGRLGEAVQEEQGRPAPGEATPDEGGGEAEPPGPGDLPNVPPEPAPVQAGPDAEAPAQPSEPQQPTQETVNDTDAAPQADSAEQGEQGETAEAPEDAGADEPVVQETPTEVTQEQRDRLRELVRARLEAARRSGTLEGGTGQNQRSTARVAKPRGQRGGSSANKEGNAVYRIGADGFVREVFRESVMILAIAVEPGGAAGATGDRLIVATGNEGQVFRVNPLAGETTVLTDVEPEQIPAILADGDDIILGTANPAKLIRLAGAVADEGSYLSPILDATQVSLWGAMRVTATIPQGGMIGVETRSGNVADPDSAPWSKWSDAVSLLPDGTVSALEPRELNIKSPPARFFQYRLTLRGDRASAPTVERVETFYVTPNMPPSIASFTAEPPEAPKADPGKEPGEPSATVKLEWEASDPNKDTLLYRLAYRPAASERYIELEDEIGDTSYEWNTRRVPDGWYVLRVTATDRRDNPPDMVRTTSRRSAPVLVDNTAPVLGDLSSTVQGRSVKITGVAEDNVSALGGLAYSVDSAEHYEPVLPSDLIFDSTRERFSVTIPGLSPGQHVITLRVRDVRGNTAYRATFVTIER